MIILATQNLRKIEEIRRLLPPQVQLGSLLDIGCEEELPETSPTIPGNARQKAEYVWDNYGADCLAEDTGLEIEALNGEPGVFTARYAGEDKNPQANMQKVLQNLKGQENRRARFRTVMAFFYQGECHLFEGIAQGHIALEPKGEGGFGYDPVFIPEGHTRSFAEMSPAEKDAISHRGKALRAFLDFVHDLTPNS